MNKVVIESTKSTKSSKKNMKVKSKAFQESQPDSPKSEIVSIKSIELLKKAVPSQKSFVDSDDTAASQTSRSTSTDLTEIKALNRNEAFVSKEFQEKMKELRSKFESKVEAFSAKYSEKVQKNMAKSLHGIAVQDFKELHHRREPKNFTEKNFKYQESLLSTLFEKNESIRAIYNIAIAAMSILLINSCVSEYNKSGTLLDYQTLAKSFSKPDVVFNLWIRFFLANMLIIPFTRWIHLSRPSSLIWVPLYLIGQFLNYYYSYQAAVANDLGFSSTVIILCEATRMSLKTHSYLRNKLLYGSDIWEKYRTLEGVPSEKNLGDEPQAHFPDIKFQSLAKEAQKYLYFHFAPTLLYRDKYIRAPKTNYKKVFTHFFNVFLCCYYGFILYKSFIAPQFENTGKNPGNFIEFILSIFSSVIPGISCLLILFFGLLHSWFNGFAELLRFPDRWFYEDWWTALEFGTYYRKWNIVVHEWLYYYVYVDLRRFTRNKASKLTAQLATFLISGVVHEVILAGAMGYFYPFLFAIFTGPGILLIRSTRFAKNRSLNIMFWFLLFVGTGIIVALYAREYYARKDGDVNAASWGYWYYIAPRSYLVYLEKSSN